MIKIKNYAKKYSGKAKYDGVQNRKFTILNDNSKFYISDAYKTLRTNILFSTGESTRKIYAVTSTVPGEGKTTTAINIAVSFAQTEKKVVIIDSDLRRPKLHKYFDLENKVGLSNVLSGIYDGESKDYIQKTNIDNLDVISSGHIPPNPIDLLASDKMQELLKTLEETYDFIILNTPPVNLVSDALVLSKNVTGYILVVRSNYTEYQALDDAMSNFELAKIKLLGVVLNDFNRKHTKYSGGKYKKVFWNKG